MPGQDLHLGDVHRLLLGRVPWTFAIEVVIRIVFIYGLLVVAMRLMGKRMASQTSRNELAALVSLAAAIGPAIQTPERGILPPLVIAIVVVGVQRAMALGTLKSARFERRTQGDVTALVVDGELDLEGLRNVVLSRERLFAQLRAKGIVSLGRIERVYLESNGSFSVVAATEPRPGLSLVPDWDEDLVAEQDKAEGKRACASCGHVESTDGDEAKRCQRCARVEWRPAVIA